MSELQGKSVKPGKPVTSQRHAVVPKVFAVVLIVATGLLATYKGPSEEKLTYIKDTMIFQKSFLESTAPGPGEPKVLMFGEKLKPLAVYMTAFAPIGVAPADFHNEGIANVVCVADPIRGKVQLMPFAGNSSFEPFEFNMGALDFKSDQMRPTGCLSGDFNHDGLTDALVYYYGRTPVTFLWDGLGNKAENYRAVEAVTPVETWYTMSMAKADFDGDGVLDLVAANYFRDDEAVLSGSVGKPAEMNSSYGVSDNGSYNRLLMGQRNGEVMFLEAKNIMKNLGGTQWSVAIAAVDLDKDHLPEIYIANDHGPDRLLHNRSTPGNPSFVLAESKRDMMTPRSKVMGRDAFHGMGIDFADINHDGNLDFMVSNITGFYTLHESHFLWMHTGENGIFKSGGAPFKDQGEAHGVTRSGWAWDLKFADFDHDGKMEIVQSTGFMRGKTNRVAEAHEMALGNDFFLRYPEVWHRFSLDDEIAGHDPVAFFSMDKDGVFKNFGETLGMHEDGVSRAVSTVDADGDGDLDFLVGNQRAAVSYRENNSKKNGDFLALNIRLPYSPTDSSAVVVRPGSVAPSAMPKSRAAMGASVVVKKADGTLFYSFVDGGSGLGGKKEEAVHIGLGEVAATEELSVALTWRDAQGTLQNKELKLTPGRHTLFLGSTAEFAGVTK